MPLYDICVDGINAFYARRPSAQQLVRREPLIGATDGANTLFLTAHKPLLYDSVAVYASNNPWTPVPLLRLDADGGVIGLATPTLSAITADYTRIPLPASKIAQVALAGFDLMQSLWARDFSLSSDNTTYTQAVGSEPHLYIVSGTTVDDPTCGTLTFSASAKQRGLLARCIDVAFLDMALADAALMDVVIRERMGGISVDPSRRAQNLALAREALWGELTRALFAAQEEVGGENMGIASVAPVHTVEYERVYHWQNGQAEIGVLAEPPLSESVS